MTSTYINSTLNKKEEISYSQISGAFDTEGEVDIMDSQPLNEDSNNNNVDMNNTNNNNSDNDTLNPPSIISQDKTNDEKKRKLVDTRLIIDEPRTKRGRKKEASTKRKYTKKSKLMAEGSTGSEDDDERFEVENILSHRLYRNRVLRYLIKWKNYPESENTNEPANTLHIDCRDTCISYWKRQPLKDPLPYNVITDLGLNQEDKLEAIKKRGDNNHYESENTDDSANEEDEYENEDEDGEKEKDREKENEDKDDEDDVNKNRDNEDAVINEMDEIEVNKINQSIPECQLDEFEDDSDNDPTFTDRNNNNNNFFNNTTVFSKMSNVTANPVSPESAVDMNDNDIDDSILYRHEQPFNFNITDFKYDDDEITSYYFDDGNEQNERNQLVQSSKDGHDDKKKKKEKVDKKKKKKEENKNKSKNKNKDNNDTKKQHQHSDNEETVELEEVVKNNYRQKYKRMKLTKDDIATAYKNNDYEWAYTRAPYVFEWKKVNFQIMTVLPFKRKTTQLLVYIKWSKDLKTVHFLEEIHEMALLKLCLYYEKRIRYQD